MFAKLYDESENQYLVLINTDEKGKPEVRFFFKLEALGLGVCSAAVGFEDDEEGWDRAERFFEIVTKEQAIEFCQKLVNDINKAL